MALSFYSDPVKWPTNQVAQMGHFLYTPFKYQIVHFKFELLSQMHLCIFIWDCNLNLQGPKLMDYLVTIVVSKKQMKKDWV